MPNHGLYGALIVLEREKNTEEKNILIQISDWNQLSATINGKGREVDSPLSLETFHLERNIIQFYRFRLINAAFSKSLYFTIDDHVLRVIALDGADIEEVKIDGIFIGPGERY